MQSTERLNQIKTQIEVHGRIDDLYKVTNRIKNELNSIKDEMKDIKQLFCSQIELNNQKLKELYSFMRRLEGVYSNGLSGDLSFENISRNESWVDTTGNDSTIKPVNSTDQLFSLEEDFQFDNLTNS
jgi:hypothetical protein